MNFSDSNHPVDDLNNSRVVLAFLAHVLDWIDINSEIPFNLDQRAGLCVILTTCKETMGKALKELEDKA